VLTTENKMTKSTEYFNWQKATTADPYYGKGPAPALVTLRDFLLSRYGGLNLGIYGIREVRGGGPLSSHAFGAAFDWRYMNADQTGLVGRAKMLNEVMPLLINNSKELGIQLIVDYVGCRSWNASRSGDQYGGWKPGTPDSHGMGQSWAGWLHIECNHSEWPDGAAVPNKLGLVPPPGTPPLPPVNFQMLQFGLTVLVPYDQRGVLRLGSKGFWVAFAQAACKKDGFGITIDSDFGNATNLVIKHFQTKKGLLADGIVGPKTWAALNAVASR
jgi:hypothetical protein